MEFMILGTWIFHNPQAPARITLSGSQGHEELVYGAPTQAAGVSTQKRKIFVYGDTNKAFPHRNISNVNSLFKIRSADPFYFHILRAKFHKVQSLSQQTGQRSSSQLTRDTTAVALPQTRADIFHFPRNFFLAAQSEWHWVKEQRAAMFNPLFLGEGCKALWISRKDESSISFPVPHGNPIGILWPLHRGYECETLYVL